MTTTEPEESSSEQVSETVSPVSPLAAEFAAIELPEERLRKALERMRQALSLEGKPDFRLFWDVRHLCIGFFREGIHPAIRSQLWDELRDITAEARRLKEHLSEQSEFASEQIELAVKGLEEELQQPDKALAQAPQIALPIPSRRLEGRLSFYDALQREVTCLTNWASRVNALRQELIKTEMRVGRKTKLFRRLSTAGDLIFPKRKECIQQLSDAFLSDVESLAQVFSKEVWPAPPYVLRDEIRAFQAFAKLLTISSKAFTLSRETLSGCWDKVRARDEEWKKQQAQQVEAFQEILSQFEEQVSSLKARFEEGVLSPDQALSSLDKIDDSLKLAELGSKERKQVRSALSEMRRVVLDRLKVEQEAQHRKHKERMRQSAQLADSLQHRMEQLLQNMDQQGTETVEAVQNLVVESSQADLSEEDRHRVQVQCELLKERLSNLNEDQLLESCRGTDHETKILEEILSTRKKRRASVKEKVEQLRREVGGSGLDIETAMASRESLDAQKQRLGEIDQQIDAVQRRLQALKIQSG